MPVLDENQMNLIADRLAEKQLSYEPLQEEFLDHLCCGIEEEMEAGYSFDQALAKTFALFPDQEFQKIEQQTLFITRKKHPLMKAFSLFVLSLVLAIPSVYWLSNAEPPSISPIGGKYKISSSFGLRMHPIHKEKKMHKGIDIVAPIGTPVLATSDGEVIKVVEIDTGYGNHIVIQHDKEHKSVYAQLHEIKVVLGQQVKIGEVIGTVGSSGASTGPHLHYEVLVNGANQDPADFIKP